MIVHPPDNATWAVHPAAHAKMIKELARESHEMEKVPNELVPDEPEPDYQPARANKDHGKPTISRCDVHLEHLQPHGRPSSINGFLCFLKDPFMPAITIK
jgi:hypothetical protein